MSSPITDRKLLRRVVGDVRPAWRAVALVLVVDLLAAPAMLLLPVPLRVAVDSVLGDKPLPGWLDAVVPAGFERSSTTLLVLAAVLAVIAVLLAQAQEVASYIVRTRTAESINLQFRARLFRQAQRLSLRFHDERGTSDSIYRIQYDALAIPGVTIDGLIPLLTAGVTLVSMLVVTMSISPRLALIALTVAPVLFALSHLYKSRARVWYREAKELESTALNVVQEVLTSLRVVKAFGREEDEQTRFVEHSSKGARARVRLVVSEAAFTSGINLTTGIGTALVLYIGVQSVQSGTLTLGELLMVMAYLGQLYGPLKTVSRKIGSLQSSLAGAERAYELLDEEPDVPEAAHPKRLGRALGALELRDVSFSYDGENTVLRDVSFAIEPGTRLGIAGRTGAGKTTLINLVTRFYDPTRGSILLDGVDLRDYAIADLRNQFGIVLQEPVLFSASIRENIAYARPSASDAEIEQAARAADAHIFIENLPSGYDTMVGERGMRLSGGERQRISLARAFLKDAPILILDEPTSSVDMRTEASIMEAMERLMRGRTTLLIAHRIATLDSCHARIEIDRGRVSTGSGDVAITRHRRRFLLRRHSRP